MNDTLPEGPALLTVATGGSCSLVTMCSYNSLPRYILGVPPLIGALAVFLRTRDSNQAT